MPKYQVRNRATATISEWWEVEAPDEATAREWFDEGPDHRFKFDRDAVEDDERDREIVTIEELT